MSGAHEARVVVTYAADEAERAAQRAEFDALGGVTFLVDLQGEARTAALGAAEALICWRLDRDLRPGEAQTATRARLVQLMSAGADHVDFGALPPGAQLASNVGAYADPMAEHALAMVLALAKRLPANHTRLAAGEFAQEATLRLRGGVAAIVGFGGIGRACARLLRCLGMRIQAINTSGRTDEDVEFVGTLDDLERVLRAAHVVVLSIPLTRATRGLIGARELGWMRPEAILVNVARGAVADEGALFEHLRANPSFTAGIDAWWDEPRGGGPFRPARPFLELPNVLGSPHNSGLVPGVMADAAVAAARNVARFLRGEPPAGLQRAEDYGS